MPGKVFLDTNVLIYALAQDDARSKWAQGLLHSGGMISVQVLNEFVSVARRKLEMGWNELRQALDAIRELCDRPVPLTMETHEEALKLAWKYHYEIYDALIMASALQAGCSTLYSQDFHDGQIIEGRLTIRNPF
jgi:predicted nucleic acid-binding protein